MNAFGLATIVAIVGGILNGDSLILQSETPLPPGLAAAVKREMALSETWEQRESPLLVVIHGVCHIPMPWQEGHIERPLGWVNKVDGQILSIIHIDCSRIGLALRRIVIDPTSTDTLEMYARAIARVIRHERRHVLLNTSTHEKAGENKSSLRADELAAPDFRRAFH
jgi:hypothetical protein